MSKYGVRRDAAYKIRRIAETPRTFANWVPVLRDMALGGVGRGPDTLRFVTRSGVSIDAPNRPGARVPVYEIFAEDCYSLRWFLGPLLDRPIQVIDIGGHIGTFSTSLAALHPYARISAFEPSPTTSGFLRRNVEQNGFGSRVTVYERALAGSSGFAEFDDNGAGSGLNGLVSAGHNTTGTATQVQTTTFDDAVTSAEAPIDFVKIDCEGGEYDLVLSSSSESWASVQRVVLEFHPVPGHEWAELRDFFAARGLNVVKEDTLNGFGCVWLSREPLAAES
jgi:FkbM family methyltransferase